MKHRVSTFKFGGVPPEKLMLGSEDPFLFLCPVKCLSICLWDVFLTKHHLKPVCLDVFQVSFYVDLWDDMGLLFELGFVWMFLFTFQFDHGKSSFTKKTSERISYPPRKFNSLPL